MWSRFDNATGTASRIGDTTSREPKVAAPNGLPTAPDSFVKVALSAQSTNHPAWAQPIDVYFKRVGTGWKLVGLEPDARRRESWSAEGELIPGCHCRHPPCRHRQFCSRS